MNRRCRECQRVNPSEAVYCYYDGIALEGVQRAAGATTGLGTLPFAQPFVFPSGEKCQNFVQLAVALRRNSQEAMEVLRHGFLESFFGSVGRMDLAMVAKASAKLPDLVRGLDDVLGKMPGSTLTPAQLQVEPSEKNLGVVQVGENRQLELTLKNKGDRLVYGKASVPDCPWLAVGEGGSAEKVFQFFDDATLQVRVRGDRLGAFSKPQKGEIVLESSGGNVTVVIQVTVPVKPFPEGVLAGALSPRQVAEKAKQSPKEAAPLIENGAVARWYEVNGWKYPVKGPTASGIAAVQQLFETLGLVKPPRVDLNESAITLSGRPGDRLEHAVTVTAQEKRPAVAYGVSDQEWLTVGKTTFRGQSATVPVTVEVPWEPNRTLTANLKVTANGNQRFNLPVTLTVGEAPPGSVPPPRAAAPPVAVVAATEPFLFLGSDAPGPAVAEPPASAVPVAVFAGIADAPAPQAIPHAAEPVAVNPPPPSSERGRLVARLLPVAIVVVGLLTAVFRDWMYREPGGEDTVAEVDYANPVLDVQFHERVQPRDFVEQASMRFGLGKPNPAGSREHFATKLVYDDFGRSCNVCVRVDRAQEFLWGIEGGSWKPPIKEPLGKDREGHRLIGARAIWVHPNPPITITQLVEIVPGGLDQNTNKRLLDTCLIRYDIANEDSHPHTVGLRFLLDTFIGKNDAVPFTIAGARQLCNTQMIFDKPADVPDFISALEKEDLNNPGTVAHLSLRYGGGLEPPSRVTLGAWPVRKLRTLQGGAAADGERTRWTVPVLDMDLAKSSENPLGDSAVTLYWEDREIPAKQTRTVGFAYGLGSVSGEKSGGLGLTSGGELVAGKDFTLTAYVKNPAFGTTITLALPKGLQLAAGTEKQDVPPLPPGSVGAYSPVTWRVKALKAGLFKVSVTLNSGATLQHKLVISNPEIFK
jgi:hypothetical protein